VANDTFAVNAGWNMIGSITYPVAVSEIGTIPGGIVTGVFFHYDGGGYNVADSIRPGYGYWVRTTRDGSLILSSSESMPAANRIRIRPDGELPPAPPDGKISPRNLPTTYALYQSYPNPFNPTTTIRYDVPTNNWVTLKVYDILGREVATLVNQMESPGYKQVTFNANALPTGVYTYRLTAGSFVQTKKLILMK
jgi:hypothetical protein